MLNNNLSITSLLTLKHTNGTNRIISYPLHHRPDWTHSLLSVTIYNHNLLFQFSEKRKWNKNEVLVDLS